MKRYIDSGITIAGNDYKHGSMIEVWGEDRDHSCDKCGKHIAANQDFYSVETGDGYCSLSCMDSVESCAVFGSE